MCVCLYIFYNNSTKIFIYIVHACITLTWCVARSDR